MQLFVKKVYIRSVSEFFKISESCNMFQKKNNITKVMKRLLRAKNIRVENIRRKVMIKNYMFLKTLITGETIFYSLGNLSRTKFCREIFQALKSIIQKLYDFAL